MDLSLFQSPEWEKFKLSTGYEKSYRIQDILVLQKNLPFGRTMLYSPLVSQAQLRDTKQLVASISQLGEKNNSIFFRLELNIPIATNYNLPATGFVKSFEEMQPEHNWVIDLTKSEEDILAGMKQKGRYNIKIAQKSGLNFASSNKKDSPELDAFYNQYAKTGKRHNISYRGKNYFEALLEILGKKEYAKACTVWKNKIPLASAIMIFYGESVLYLYGGSNDKHRDLMAPYLLHWELIREAKKLDLKEYNFLGVAPNDDPKHPWAGITRFKKQFGGEQIDIAGCYDLPIKPFEYQIFKMAEKIRR